MAETLLKSREELEDDENVQAGQTTAFRSLGLLRPVDNASGEDELSDKMTEKSRMISESYQGFKSRANRSDLLPPATAETHAPTDVANILLHDEMAVLGATLDRNGLMFDLDTMVNAWTDHPFRSY